MLAVGVHHIVDQGMFTPKALSQELDGGSHVPHVNVMLPADSSKYVELKQVNE
jgi:hypothetical protein